MIYPERGKIAGIYTCYLTAEETNQWYLFAKEDRDCQAYDRLRCEYDVLRNNGDIDDALSLYDELLELEATIFTLADKWYKETVAKRTHSLNEGTTC